MIIIEKPFAWTIFGEKFYVVGCNNTKIYIKRNLSDKEPYIKPRNLLTENNKELDLNTLLTELCNSNKRTIDALNEYPEYFLG